MAINRTIFKNGFSQDNVPEWTCPTCKKGILKGSKSDFAVKEGSLSKSYHKEEDWDPAWISGVFSGMLHCDNLKCQEDVAVIGKMDVQDEAVYYTEYDYDVHGREILMPKLFIPALDIFQVHKNIPKEISDQVKESFYLHWVDSSACANRIRIVVELIMDYHRIKKTTIEKNGKRKGLTLHSRIDAFKNKYPSEADMLMAIKWLGNSGSHASDLLKKDDTLDGFEILEHVLNNLYETDTKRIQQLSKSINKRKGPIKKR